MTFNFMYYSAIFLIGFLLISMVVLGIKWILYERDLEDVGK